MKILHVNNKFHFQGGSEQYLYEICCELNLLGHENVVLYGGPYKTEHNNQIATAYHISYLDDFNTRLKQKLRGQIMSIMDRENPDIIYLHNICNPYLVQVLTESRPVVKYVHDHEFYCAKKIRIVNNELCSYVFSLHCIVNALRGNGYKCMGGRSMPLTIAKTAKQMFMNSRVHHGIKQFIVASDHMKRNLMKQGYPGGRIAIIPYFTAIPCDIVPDNGNSNILFVGRLSPEKGLDIFLESLLLLEHDFHFVVVGEGHPVYVSMLRAAVRERGLEEKVEFAGWVGNRELGSYYQGAAFLAVPSIWPEPFGIIGIESMAYGRPAVAFNVGGIKGWLEDGKTGFLVERNNIREFAGRMDLLLMDKSLRQELGRNAYERSKTLFNKAVHINNLMSVFTDVLKTEE